MKRIRPSIVMRQFYAEFSHEQFKSRIANSQPLSESEQRTANEHINSVSARVRLVFERDMEKSFRIFWKTFFSSPRGFLSCPALCEYCTESSIQSPNQIDISSFAMTTGIRYECCNIWVIIRISAHYIEQWDGKECYWCTSLILTPFHLFRSFAFISASQTDLRCLHK